MSPRLFLPALAAAFVLAPAARSCADGLPLFTSKADTAVFFPGANSENTIRFEDGAMVVFDIPVTGKDETFGYARTPFSLRNYRFAMEFAWGTKKFAPRANETRNSGLLYHIQGADKLWPECFECQVQEGDVGDLHQVFQRTEKSGVETRVKPGVKEPTYDPTGEEMHVGGRLIRWQRMDKAEGWNAVELTTRENAAEHKVNGTVVARLWNAARPDGSPCNEGAIALQAEGAEIRYRNASVTPLTWPPDHERFRVLLFTKEADKRHTTTADSAKEIVKLGERFGFDVTLTNDSTAFTPQNLQNFKAVVFLNTTGDVFDASQEQAFESYMRNGGGFVGIHAAVNTEKEWPFYRSLVGSAKFAGHPAIQPGTLKLVKDDTESTSVLPRTWQAVDEFYNLDPAPRGVEVLVEVDESSFKGGTMGTHPLTWQTKIDKGRAWYTSMGHTLDRYHEPLFLLHVLGGIQYAAGIPSAPMPVIDGSKP